MMFKYTLRYHVFYAIGWKWHRGKFGVWKIFIIQNESDVMHCGRMAIVQCHTTYLRSTERKCCLDVMLVHLLLLSAHFRCYVYLIEVVDDRLASITSDIHKDHIDWTTFATETF